MKTTAEKNAQKKYQNKIRTTVKAQLNCTIDRNDFNAIDEYCKNMNISKASFITSACKYIIENDIPLSEFIKKSKT